MNKAIYGIIIDVKDINYQLMQGRCTVHPTTNPIGTNVLILYPTGNAIGFRTCSVLSTKYPRCITDIGIYFITHSNDIDINAPAI